MHGTVTFCLIQRFGCKRDRIGSAIFQYFYVADVIERELKRCRSCFTNQGESQRWSSQLKGPITLMILCYELPISQQAIEEQTVDRLWEYINTTGLSQLVI